AVRGYRVWLLPRARSATDSSKWNQSYLSQTELSPNQRRTPRRTRGVVNARVARNVMFRATGVCLRGDSGRAECSVLVLLFLLLDDQGLGGENQGGDRSGVAQRRAGDFDGVDDSGADEVAVLTGRGVVALTGFEVGHLGHDDVTVLAGVLGDPAQRLDDSALDDLSTGGRIAGQSEVVSAEHLRGMDQSGSTTGDDALFDGGTSSGHGVFDAVLALLALHLGGGADLDDGDTAGELGQALLQLLAVPVGVGVLDFGADLGDTSGHSVIGPGTIDDGGVVLGDGDGAGVAELFQGDLVELHAHIRGDDLAAGEDGEVLEDGLATVTEARCLDGGDVEDAAQLVDDQRRQCFALDVVGDDEQRLAGLLHLLENRQELLDVGDLALVDEDESVGEHSLLTIGIGHEVGREEALVELHALGDLEFDRGGLGLVDRDDAVLAHLVEGIGDELADLFGLSGQTGDMSDLRGVGDIAGDGAELFGHGLDGGFDSALELTGCGTGGDVAQSFVDEGLGQNGRGGGSVTGDVVGLGGDFLGQLDAEVLVRV